MRIIIKLFLSIIVLIVWVFLNGLQNHLRGSKNGSFGAIGTILFLGFIGALIGIWRYKKKPSSVIEKTDGDDIKNITKF